MINLTASIVSLLIQPAGYILPIGQAKGGGFAGTLLNGFYGFLRAGMRSGFLAFFQNTGIPAALVGRLRALDIALADAGIAIAL